MVWCLKITNKLMAKLKRTNASLVLKASEMTGNAIAASMDDNETIFVSAIKLACITSNKAKIRGFDIKIIPADVATPLPPLKPKTNE